MEGGEINSETCTSSTAGTTAVAMTGVTMTYADILGLMNQTEGLNEIIIKIEDQVVQDYSLLRTSLLSSDEDPNKWNLPTTVAKLGKETRMSP